MTKSQKIEIIHYAQLAIQEKQGNEDVRKEMKEIRDRLSLTHDLIMCQARGIVFEQYPSQ